MSHRSDGRLRSDEGIALVAAIVGMLLLGVFALSVSVLADLESRLGLNHRAAQQALALAEAGLEHGRNMLRDAVTAGNFNAFIASAAARQLGVPTAGILLGSGRYWVRVDNDCAAPAGFVGTPAFVPPVVEDDRDGAGCLDTVDANQTVVLTAWSEVPDGAGRVIGRARLRAHYTIARPWKHACFDQDGELCIGDAVAGCNNNPCIDPSDPRHPNGPSTGELPIPSHIRCGTGGSPPYPGIPDEDIPNDVKARMTPTAPCVIYPYYHWAIRTAAPTRTTCRAILATGYGTDECDSSLNMGTFAWTPDDPKCDDKPSKCHGLVFFGPGQNPGFLGNKANIEVRTSGGHIGCVGGQKELPAADCYNAVLSESDSKVIYVMGTITIRGGAVQGTVVVHGDGPGGLPIAFALQGQSQVTTHPCPAGSPLPSPGCGYPLAILAYNPSEPAPTVVTGQSMHLELSNSSLRTLVSGLIYTGGTAHVSPLTVNGGLIGHDVNIETTSTRMTYDPTYGNAAPPPGFETSTGGSSSVLMYPATWVHCTYYANETDGPSPCS
jgi:hypothetical protein